MRTVPVESMAAMKMVAEDEATSRLSEIYGDIKDTIRIDVVPNIYKAMATNPAYLEAMAPNRFRGR